MQITRQRYSDQLTITTAYKYSFSSLKTKLRFETLYKSVATPTSTINIDQNSSKHWYFKVEILVYIQTDSSLLSEIRLRTFFDFYSDNWF